MHPHRVVAEGESFSSPSSSASSVRLATPNESFAPHGVETPTASSLLLSHAHDAPMPMILPHPSSASYVSHTHTTLSGPEEESAAAMAAMPKQMTMWPEMLSTRGLTPSHLDTAAATSNSMLLGLTMDSQSLSLTTTTTTAPTPSCRLRHGSAWMPSPTTTTTTSAAAAAAAVRTPATRSGGGTGNEEEAGDGARRCRALAKMEPRARAPVRSTEKNAAAMRALDAMLGH